MLDGLTLIHRAFPRKPRGPLELDAGGGPGLSPGDLTRGGGGLTAWPPPHSLLPPRHGSSHGLCPLGQPAGCRLGRDSQRPRETGRCPGEIWDPGLMEHGLCLLLLNPSSPQNGGALGLRRRGWNRGSRAIQPPQPHGADPLVPHSYQSGETPSGSGSPPAVSRSPVHPAPQAGQASSCWCWDLTEPEMGASPHPPMTDLDITSLLLQVCICSHLTHWKMML